MSRRMGLTCTLQQKKLGLTMGTLMSEREIIRYSLKPEIEAKSPAA